MPIKSLSQSSLLSFQKYSSLLAGNTAYEPVVGAYDLLETEILTGSQASVTFSNLNSTYGTDYQHLQIRMTSRTNASDVGDWLRYRFNSDSTGSNYNSHSLYGDGSAVASSQYAGSSGSANGGTLYAASLAANATANAFTGLVIDILDPFETTKYTTLRALYGSHGNYNRIVLTSSVWMNSAAITTFSILSDSGSSFVSGSRFSLYGLKAA